MCRSSDDHVPSLGETQGHTGTSRARVCVYSSCPPLPVRCGRGGGGFRTEGMRPAKQPDANPPPAPRATAAPCVCVTTAPSSHAPCPCAPGTSAMLSCCGGTRYPLSPPPPKRCRVHTEWGGGEFRQGKFLRGNLRVSDWCRNFSLRNVLRDQGQTFAYGGVY